MKSFRFTVTDRDVAYHIHSQTLDGQRLFDEKARSVFCKQLHAKSEFLGVELLTYAAMENEFHLLVGVPMKREPSREETLRRAEALYGEAKVKQLQSRLSSKNPAHRGEAQETLKRYSARMGDLRLFLRELKSEFSRWYNQDYDRFGALWAKRYKSQVVEKDPNVLLKIAAYIDLAPVREGLCEDPKDYPFSGFGKASQGSLPAMAAMCRLCGVMTGKEALRLYRECLYGGVEAIPAGKASGKSADPKNKPSLADALRQPVDWLGPGGVLGSPDFVKEIGALFREKQERKHEIRPKTIPEVYGVGLAAMRTPRKKSRQKKNPPGLNKPQRFKNSQEGQKGALG